MLELRKRTLGKIKEIKSFGNSMWPVLQDGDIVKLDKVQFEHIKTNDIICVKQKGRLLTHRVIYIGRNHVITKGDHVVKADSPSFKRNLVGKVASFVRNGEKFNIDDIYLFQSTIYLKEVSEIIDTLYKEKINVVVLKGIPLHLYFEKKHPRRIYADCDLLVDKIDYKKLEKTLIKQGYRKRTTFSVTGSKIMEAAEVSFDKNLNGFIVEFDVHRDMVFLLGTLGRVDSLYPQKLVDALNKKFLDEKIEITINQKNFPIFEFENLFIYLCLHLFHHNFKGIYRYELLSKIIGKNLDVERLKNTINDYRLENFIYPVLYFYNNYFRSNKSVTTLLKELRTEKNYKLTKETFNKVSIFDGDYELGQGHTFRTLFAFSPYPLWRRLLVFLDMKVLQAIMSVIFRKIRRVIFLQFLQQDPLILKSK